MAVEIEYLEGALPVRPPTEDLGNSYGCDPCRVAAVDIVDRLYQVRQRRTSVSVAPVHYDADDVQVALVQPVVDVW